MTDEEKLQIIIEAKNQAAPAIDEARLQLMAVKRALDEFAQAELDGMTATFAMREALKSFRDMLLEAGVSTEGQKTAVNQLRDAMLLFNGAVAVGIGSEAAMSAAVAAATGELVVQTAEVDRAKRKWTEFAGMNVIASGLLGAAGMVGKSPFAVLGGLLNPITGFIGPLLGVAAAIAAIYAAALPLTGILTVAIVDLTAFAAAGAAMMIALGGASLMFLGLAGGVVLLANHFGTIAGPMQTFKNDLNALGDDLARKATPAAREILTFLERLMPTLDKLGSGVLKWFSGELPKSLQMIAFAFNDLVPDFRAFGEFLGAMFDHVAPQIGPMFEALTRFGLGAIEGLISNLVRMSDWFQKELPTIGPAASQIFSGIGNAVQWIGTNFGNLADFLAKKWPDIVGVAKAFLDGFNTAFQAFNVNMQGLGKFDAQGFFHGLGVVIGGVVSILWDLVNVFAIIIQQAFAALPAAFASMGYNWTLFVRGVVQDINTLIAAYDRLPGFLRGGGGNIPLITAPSLPPGVGQPATGGQTHAFASGGTVPGPMGAPMLATVHGGESVLSNDAQDQMIQLLTQLVTVALAQLDKMGSGGGYSALANLEYARSRGMT